MKDELVNISFIDGNSKNQRYCFLVKPIENDSVVFLGFRNYNFKKKMSLKTFLFLYEEHIHRSYKIIYATRKFNPNNMNDNSVFFTIINLIDLKIDAKSPIKFKIRWVIR